MKSLITSVPIAAATVWLAGGCATSQPEVYQYGRMQDVLGAGAAEATAQANLGDVQEEEHGAVGVGALVGLEGEVTLLDGRVWVTRSVNGAPRTTGPSSSATGDAALLAVAYVEEWEEIEIEEEYLAGPALEAFIAEMADEYDLDSDEPFPFVLEGNLTNIQFHVMNGACPMQPDANLDAGQQPWRHYVGQPTPAKIVGIYARDAAGDMTHPGTSIHAHVILVVQGQQVTGHVETMALAGGAILKLPAM